MECERCGGATHRDDAMNRRCNDCERLTRQCICDAPNNVTCGPLELSDGTRVLVRSRGRLTQEDRKAVEDFNDFLKCQTCVNRHKCALWGCAAIKLQSPD